MPVGVAHLHLRGEAGAYPTGAVAQLSVGKILPLKI